MSDLFSNPVFAGNFPDPGVLAQDGVWHAYGTDNAAANVPPLTSSDLVHWSEAGDVLPVPGSWAVPGRTWAPEVLRTSPGRYVRVLHGPERAAETAVHRRGGTWILYPAWLPGAIGRPSPGRQLWVDRDGLGGRPAGRARTDRGATADASVNPRVPFLRPSKGGPSAEIVIAFPHSASRLLRLSFMPSIGPFLVHGFRSQIAAAVVYTGPERAP